MACYRKGEGRGLGGHLPPAPADTTGLGACCFAVTYTTRRQPADHHALPRPPKPQTISYCFPSVFIPRPPARPTWVLWAGVVRAAQSRGAARVLAVLAVARIQAA